MFRALLKRDPKAAKDCADLAIEAMVHAKDFKLAFEYLPHPEKFLLDLSERLNERLAYKGGSRAIANRRREAFVHNYCQDVRTVAGILIGLGNRESAQAVREWSVALVEQRKAREMVGTDLSRR